MLFSLPGLAAGQINPGTPSFSAYDGGPYDTINMQNLNVSLNVPVMSKNGAYPLSASLTCGNSYVYYQSPSLEPGILAVPLNPSINGILSPFGYTQVLASSTSSHACPQGDGTWTATKYSGWYLLFPDGTAHNLPPTEAAYGGPSVSRTK
jgi:hypothetical protein